MPDAGTITKQIVEVYSIDARPAKRELSELERRTRRLKRAKDAAAKAAGGLASSVRSVGMVGGAAVGGLAFVAKKLFDIGSEAETSEIALSGLLQRAGKMQGLSLPFATARKQAGDLRLEFMRLAKTSPVTASEIGEAFSAAAFGLSRAGVSFA